MVWKMSESSDPSALIWCCEFGNILNIKRTLKCWLWCVRAPFVFCFFFFCLEWTKWHLWTSVRLWVLHRKMEMQNEGCSAANSYYAFVPPKPLGTQGSSHCSVMSLRLSEQQQLDMLRLMSVSGSSPMTLWVIALDLILCNMWVEYRTLRTAR